MRSQSNSSITTCNAKNVGNFRGNSKSSCLSSCLSRTNVRAFARASILLARKHPTFRSLRDGGCALRDEPWSSLNSPDLVSRLKGGLLVLTGRKARVWRVRCCWVRRQLWVDELKQQL